MKRFRVLLALVGVLLWAAPAALAQTQTTGAISGVVTDPSGGVIPGAVVAATNQNTGVLRDAKTNKGGYYSLPLLPPGTYLLTVKANGFETIARQGIGLAIDHTVRVDFQLRVGSLKQSVTVRSQAPLLEPSNPNNTTTVSARQLENLPNPGQDLSYPATVAPGAIMETTTSAMVGDTLPPVEFNGLPSIDNDFTIDGMDANDAWMGENRTGASGMQLGLNAIQEVSINTNSYGANLGRLGASQMNYITKSGTNAFHGNGYEIWNGASMNASDFFFNANPTKPAKPFSNTNEFGGSVGGPILRNKLFFFTDLEGIRIILPQLLTSTLPTPAYESYVLQQLPQGGVDSVLGNMPLPPEPAEVPLYQSMFKLLGTTGKGVPLAILGCPLGAGASGNDGNGCATTLLSSARPPVAETLWTIKTDYNLSAKDTFWFRFQLNNGQNTTVNAVSPLFNVVDSEPVRAASASWTHTFGATLVNQFNPGFSYQNRVHYVPNLKTVLAAMPITLQCFCGLSAIGAGQTTYGDRTTTWQLNDNLSWIVGNHSFAFGENLRRVLFSSEESAGEGVLSPFVDAFSLPEFTYGAAGLTFQGFPQFLVDHLGGVGLDSYAMDTYKATSKLTVTVGLRVAWNSNPVSYDNVISRLAQPFSVMSHDVNQPLNQVIVTGQHHMFASTYPLMWEPRAAVAYALTHRTLFRAGAGIFANPMMGFLPTYLDANAPSDVTVEGGMFGPAGGVAMFPGVPNSAISADIAAAQAFQSNFKSGALSCASPNAGADCVPVISFTTFESVKQKYPKDYQWSAGIEQELSANYRLTLNYVGTSAIDGFYIDGLNGYQTVCPGCFNNYPYDKAPDPRFGNIFPFHTGAGSHYNALQLSFLKRMTHGLSFQANYTYSHCLDYISNGGILTFNVNENFYSYNGRLDRLYGDCDFDVRHSFNGSYLYELPFHASNRWLNQVIGGWQVSGTVYLRGGFPFSAESWRPGGGFINAFPTLFANVVPGQNPYAKSPIAGVTTPGTIQWVNPNAFQSVVDPSTNTCYPMNSPANCQDGNAGRNILRAPDFRWTDIDFAKRFPIHETMALRFDVQIYNLFNHPNFGFPNAYYGFPGNVTAGIPGEAGTLTGFGVINNTVSPSTGLLGAALGGDSSVRMIALRAGFEF